MTSTKEQITLAEKRPQWLEVLSGKDRHSIINQLTEMTWNAAVYQIVNEARRLAPTDSNGGVQLNGTLHGFIDHCFFTSHMAAVRRLSDTCPLEGKRGVYSLAGLLDDMKLNRELLTREAIFSVEKRPYDYEHIRQRSLEYDQERIASGEQAYCVPQELRWENHERRHKNIDRLSDTLSESRQPGDIIIEDVFNNLRQKADSACEKVVTHVTQFIAHAGSPESRRNVQVSKWSMTLDHLWKAHRSLCEVASFIAIVILGDSCPGFLPIPQFNQFEHIERGLVTLCDLPTLQKIWQDLDREYHNWSQWTLEDYEREFSQQVDE